MLILFVIKPIVLLALSDAMLILATLKTHAYKCYVRPVLEYSSTVWDPYTVSPTRKLKSVQSRAARYTLCRYRRTSSGSGNL